VTARDRSQRPEARPLRLFVAVDVPDWVKASLETAVAPFRDRDTGIRWTKAEGWHVTLKFLGSTWPRLLDEVRATVASAASATEPFQTRLTEIGVFPGPRRARVVWAGLEDPDARFAEIVRLLDESLSDHFRTEKRPFTPHLTMARLNPPRSIEEAIPGLVGMRLESEPFSVDRLVLYRSHLSPLGARYEALEAPGLSRTLG
jgi:2'-5' RNA ligase